MVAGWKGLPVVAALVLVGAVSFTLVAAYQWAGRLGIFGEAATLARLSAHVGSIGRVLINRPALSAFGQTGH
jgi:hypothetical protein